MRIFVVGMFAGALACSSEVRPGLPPLDQARSLLIARPDVEGVRVEAFDVRAGVLLDFELELDAPTELTGLSYAEDLAALGLAPGPLPSASPGQCGGRPLPMGAKIHTLLVDPDALSGATWAAIDRLPTEVADYRRQAPCPCLELVEPRIYDLERGAVPIAIGLDDRTALIDNVGPGVPYDDVRVLHPEGLAPDRVVDFPPGVAAAIAFGPEEIWVGDGYGLSRGGLMTPFERALPLSGRGIVEAIAGTSSAVLYASTSSSILLRFEHGRVETLIDHSIDAQHSRQRPDVAVIGPESVVALIEGEITVALWSPSRVLELPLDPDTRGGRTVVPVPGLGVVVGTYIGSFHLARESGLDDLPFSDQSVRSPIDAILPLSDGFIYSSESGGAQQYVVGFGFCEPPPLLGNQRFQAIIKLGEYLAFIGPNGMRGRAIVLRVVPPTGG